jgi:hypothetical protein
LRLGNLSRELGGLGSSFPDHALGPNWDSGLGTRHMLTSPFGRPVVEQNHTQPYYFVDLKVITLITQQHPGCE